jgi:hypothetical protein
MAQDIIRVLALAQDVATTAQALYDILSGVDHTEDKIGALQFGVDAIVADLSPTISGSLKETLFARTATILTDVEAARATTLPAILAAIQGGGGGGGADVDAIWGYSVGIDPTGGSVSAYNALGWLYHALGQDWNWGLYRYKYNPDFALSRFNQVAVEAQGFGYLDALVPPTAGTLADIGAYLNANTPGHVWALVGRHWRTVHNTDFDVHSVSVWCLAQPAAAAGGEGGHDPMLDTILGGVGGVRAVVDETAADVDTLLARTVHTEAADNAILVSIDPRVKTYLPEPNEGALSDPVAVAGELDVTLPVGTSFVLIELDTIPAGLGGTATDPALYEPLGQVVFGVAGRWENGIALRRGLAWVRVSPGATDAHLALQPGVSGVYRLCSAL